MVDWVVIFNSISLEYWIFRRFNLNKFCGTGCRICKDISVGKLSGIIISSLKPIEIIVIMSHVDALLFRIELGKG